MLPTHLLCRCRMDNHTLFMAEMRNLDFTQVAGIQMTLLGDQDPGYSHSDYECSIVTRDCAGAKDYRYRCVNQ